MTTWITSLRKKHAGLAKSRCPRPRVRVHQSKGYNMCLYGNTKGKQQPRRRTTENDIMPSHAMPSQSLLQKGKNAAPIQFDPFACRSVRISFPDDICTTCSTPPSNFRHSSFACLLACSRQSSVQSIIYTRGHTRLSPLSRHTCVSPKLRALPELPDWNPCSGRAVALMFASWLWPSDSVSERGGGSL